MKYPKKWQLKFGTSYQGITYKLMYLFEDLKYFNSFMLIEDFNLCLKYTSVFVCFCFHSFKNTSIEKNHLGENFTVKYKMCDKIQILKQQSLFSYCVIFSKHTF